ncbi:hypothetical protein CEJ86_17670 [Sinorhizobium meliloti]|uniref:Uncharacterized protein n=1 Tax=Rhizobium meliloti TaxID=382 RepID=A0A2J0Z124_RHIML|nr:hypothetical protein CEJ86_17670 [Sinorhizobium meliloti]
MLHPSCRRYFPSACFKEEREVPQSHARRSAAGNAAFPVFERAREKILGIRVISLLHLKRAWAI